VKRGDFFQVVSEKGYPFQISELKVVPFSHLVIEKGTFLTLSRSVVRGAFQTLCMSMILYKIYTVGPPG